MTAANSSIGRLLSRCAYMLGRSAENLRPFSTQIDVLDQFLPDLQPLSLLKPTPAPRRQQFRQKLPLIAGQHSLLPQTALSLTQLQQNNVIILPQITDIPEIIGTKGCKISSTRFFVHRSHTLYTLYNSYTNTLHRFCNTEPTEEHGEQPQDGTMMCKTKRTFQPSLLIRKRRHGFLSRLAGRGGRRVVARRKARGRWKITA